MGQEVSFLYRQISEVMSGRYHAKTLPTSVDLSFMLGYAGNRKGSVANLIPWVGQMVAKGAAHVHAARILRRPPATVAGLGHTEAGTYVAEIACKFIADPT